MGQRYYLDESQLNEELEKLDNHLMESLNFAFIHEDMLNTVEELMSEWGKDNMSTYQDILNEWENMSETDKEMFDDDIDDYLRSEMGRWWIEDFSKLDDESKKLFIHRYRMTIATCMFSNTYDMDSIREEIDNSFSHLV